MARGDGTYAPKDDGEMNVRMARQLAAEIKALHPTYWTEVWVIAQGLARVCVEPTKGTGIVRAVIRSRREAILLGFVLS